MTNLDLDALCEHVRSADYLRGTPDQVALWREDLEESRANLAIEGMDPTPEDDALLAMLLEEGLSPAAMVRVITSLYTQPDAPC